MGDLESSGAFLSTQNGLAPELYEVPGGNQVDGLPPAPLATRPKETMC